MRRRMMKSKVHRATVTSADLHYVGSISLDPVLMDAADIREWEQVAVLDEKSVMIGRALAGVQVLGTPQELDAIVGEFAVHGVKVSRVIFAGESDLISNTALHDVERVCRKRNRSDTGTRQSAPP